MMRCILSLLVLTSLFFVQGAQAQDFRLLIDDHQPDGYHGQEVKEVFQRTAAGYGLATEVEVRNIWVR